MHTTVDADPRRAIEHLVHAARRHLSMEAAFLAELTATEQLYRVTTEAAGTFSIEEGGTLPRLEGFCQHVMERGAAWVVPDTDEDPVAAAVPVKPIGRFGAYIGVPVRHLDGRDFGTLCCMSHHAEPDLGDRDVAVLEALADVLAFHLGQLEEAADTRRRLEEEGEDLAARLRQHELQLGLLSEMVQAARTPAMVLDPSTLRVDYANRAVGELLGASTDQLVGAPMWEHAERWTEDGVRHLLRDVLSGQAPMVRFEVEDSTSDGHILDVVAQRVTSAGGDTLILVTGHDVTARRRAEDRLQDALELEREAGDELRRLDAMRNAFLTAVSHELRTPLTAVRLAAETLHRQRASPDLVPTLVERLFANAMRLDRLLGDLLDLNQFAHGQLRLERERVRLDELVRAAVVEAQVGATTIRLELEPIEGSVAPTKVERIVVNLVRNASIHAPGGVVTVRLESTDEGARLSVEDRGPGVGALDRERLFLPFEQGPTAPRHQPGTGIGLSLVAAFAELHGGRAWVEDVPGGGAAFRVLLPLGDI